MILPLLLFLLLFAVDFGRLFFSWIQVSNAAREAAAYGAANPTDASGITTYAHQETSVQAQRGEGALTVAVVCANPVGNTIPCSNSAGGAGSGNTMTVTVREPFTFITPWIGNLFGGNLMMGASATAAVLGEAAGSATAPPGGCPTPAATFSVVYTGGIEVFVNPSASQPDSGLCAISGYNWDFGDGETDVGTAVGTLHAYPAPGTYTVTLTVTNQAGESSMSQTLAVPPPTPSPAPTPSPTPAASPTPTPVPPATPAPTPSPTPTPSPAPTPTPCTAPAAWFTFTSSGKTYNFRDTSTVSDPENCPIYTWLWDFGDGTFSNAMNPVHTYGSSKSYTVKLSVTSSAGTGHASRTTK